MDQIILTCKIILRIHITIKPSWILSRIIGKKENSRAKEFGVANGRKIHVLTRSNIKDGYRVKDEKFGALPGLKKDMDISCIPAPAYGMQKKNNVVTVVIARNQCRKLDVYNPFTV
ncbi:hypothetical protein AVEN_55766-1 [Araneus ventricosus]|uniref:Uncharacterized protein n=1 Tax=Araneus ventricosus TaxID=182803 RepID=A0A4Y2EZY9_ARAVE|nr:hypothetical protein AVEN_55766-1 [Araneus ventricosus]